MIHRHLLQEDCYTLDDIDDAINKVDTESQIAAFNKIQTYVLVTIFVLLLQLGHLMKPFAYGFFRLLSWLSYLLVPVLISYILGLMGRPVPGYGYVDKNVVGTFRYLTCVWVIFLMFAYAGFDNLNAFSLDERHGRSRLVLRIAIQFSLLLLIVYQLPAVPNLIPVSFAFLILTFKFGWRLVALAHSAGATPRIKTDVARIINYMNLQAAESSGGDDKKKEAAATADPVTMEGFNYLVGPKYAKIEDERIVDGVTMEKIWRSKGRLLAADSGNMQLKDTCLSFSLFWLLLGKFWSYPLYDNELSRGKAWRLVRHGLLPEKGDHERVFRVIEIELAFLRDYFHARYIFFYLNGFYWKLISVVALPVMFWWFIQKAINYDELNKLTKDGYGTFKFTSVANTIVISVIVALEAMQLVVFLISRWLKVTLLCFYTRAMASPNTGCLSRFFLEVLGFVFLGSSRSSNSAFWRKPWKRELDQYSLVQSCTPVFKSTGYLKLQFISIFGIPLSKPGRKQGKKVKLSNLVKEAVVSSLQGKHNDDPAATRPKLSNGAESLMRNGVTVILPEWACKLKNDTETILVWHIATSVCELHDPDQQHSSQSSNDMKVATSLSKYCAYLLFFAPSLLPVPALEAESITETVVKDAIKLFKKPFFGCGKASDEVKYDKMMELISDEEFVGGDYSVLTKGAMVGKILSSKDWETRWKILAEFWAEMILYLAPSDNNEMAHASKLSQGGEFITQLWALLIHAGISDRDDIAAANGGRR